MRQRRVKLISPLICTSRTTAMSSMRCSMVTGLAVARHVGEGDGACFQIGNVAGGSPRRRGRPRARATDARGAIDGLAVADRCGDATGVADDGEASRTEDRHPPVAGQAHRVDAQQRRIQGRWL